MLAQRLAENFRLVILPAENRYFSTPWVISVEGIPSSMSSSDISKAELWDSLIKLESVVALFDCPAILCTLLPSPSTETETSDENSAGRMTANKMYETRKAYNLY